MHACRLALAGVAVALAACSEPVSEQSDADNAAPAVSMAQGRAGDDHVVPGDVLVGLKEESAAEARAYGLTVRSWPRGILHHPSTRLAMSTLRGDPFARIVESPR
jgi:hypothetical protein